MKPLLNIISSPCCLIALLLGLLSSIESSCVDGFIVDHHKLPSQTLLAAEAANNCNELKEAALLSRRSIVVATAAAASSLTTPSTACAAANNNGLPLQKASKSGLRWADAKVGSGETPSLGSQVSIDYSMASTAGRFPQIYSTKDKDLPYRWKLGDGSTIQGIELAILGSKEDNIPPMRPGGIRRVIVPNNLGYNDLISNAGSLSPSSSNKRCVAGNEGSVGPIPPKGAGDGAYQRWYQFYCNPRIPYQPDLVLDIKLYGKRTTTALNTAAQ